MALRNPQDIAQELARQRVQQTALQRFGQSAWNSFKQAPQQLGTAVGTAITARFELGRQNMEAATDRRIQDTLRLQQQRALKTGNIDQARQLSQRSSYYGDRSANNLQGFGENISQQRNNAIAGTVGTGLQLLGAKGMTPVKALQATVIPTVFGGGFAALTGGDVATGAGQGLGQSLQLAGINKITDPLLAGAQIGRLKFKGLNPAIAGMPLAKRALIKAGSSGVINTAENELQTRVNEQRGQTAKELALSFGMGATTGAGGEIVPAAWKSGKEALNDTKKNLDVVWLDSAYKQEQKIEANKGIQTRQKKGQYGPKSKVIEAVRTGENLDPEIPLIHVRPPGNQDFFVTPSQLYKNESLQQFIVGPGNDAAKLLRKQAYSGGFIKPDEFFGVKTQSFESPYSRGDIGKLENQLDELIGTQSYVNSGKWQAKGAARQTALAALQDSADRGDVEAQKYLTVVQMLQRSIEEAKTAKNIKPSEVIPSDMSKGAIDQGKIPDQVGNLEDTQLSQSQVRQQTGLEQTFPQTGGLELQQSPKTPDLQEAGKQLQVKQGPSGDFNTDNLNVPKKVKLRIKKDVEAIRPQIEKTVGKKLSNAEVVEVADRTSKTINSAVGRDQTLQWEAALLKTRQKLAALSKKGVVDREYLETLLAVKTLGTDIGRKLQSFSIGADPKLITSKQVILESILKTTDDVDRVLKAAQGVDFNNFNEATKFYRQFIQPSKSEWLDLLRYNSMLSSPNTHFNNIASNFQGTGLIAPIEKTITGGIDALKSALTGAPREYRVGEGAAYAKGYYSNVGNAVSKFAQVMKGEVLDTNPDTRNIRLAPSGGVAGKAESALSLPMKLLEASDQFFTTLTTAGETASQRYKQAGGIKLKGMTPEQVAAKKLFRSELGENNGSTVLDALDVVANSVQSLKNSKNPVVSTIAKFSLPFLKTPTNILKQGVEYTPLGLTTLVGSSTKTEQLAKVVLGSSIGSAVALLVGSDRLTWAEPTSEKQKQMFRASGMQPYSVKIGDNWVSYSKLHPAISFNFAMVAAVKDSLDKKTIDEEQAETVLKGLAKWVQFYADQSYMKNIGDVLSSVQGDIESPTRVATNYATQLIPYRALMGWVTRIIDPYQRKADKDGSALDKALQQVASGIPLVSESVPTRNDSYGMPIPNQNRLLNAVSPARVTTENPYRKVEFNNYMKDLKDKKNLDSQKDVIRKQFEGNTQIDNSMPTDQGQTTSDNKILYYKNGNVETVDLGKITAMPEKTGYERILKQREAYSTLSALYQSDTVTPDMKEKALSQVGITKENMEYYLVAKENDDVKTAYVYDKITEFATNQDRQGFLQWLAENRKDINGSQVVSDGVVSQLKSDGLLSSQESKLLKQITVDQNGKRLSKVTGRKPKKLKSFKPPAFKAPKQKRLQVRKGTRLKALKV